MTCRSLRGLWPCSQTRLQPLLGLQTSAKINKIKTIQHCAYPKTIIEVTVPTVVPTKSDSDVVFGLQLMSETLTFARHLSWRDSIDHPCINPILRIGLVHWRAIDYRSLIALWTEHEVTVTLGWQDSTCTHVYNFSPVFIPLEQLLYKMAHLTQCQVIWS